VSARGGLVAFFLAGCSYAANGSDMAVPYGCQFSGDVTATVECVAAVCPSDFTHPNVLTLTAPANDPTNMYAGFALGPLVLPSYTQADLPDWRIYVTLGGVRYSSRPITPSPNVTLTVSGFTSGGECQCYRSVSGTATATLVETIPDDAGGVSFGPGRAMLNATF
jgi:hypothetical protein